MRFFSPVTDPHMSFIASFLRSWCKLPSAKRARPLARSPRRPILLRVEQLEDRTVPTVVDLTTAGSSGAILGAQFLEGTGITSGTGLIESFVRLEKDGIEQGYNTDSRPVQFDEKTDATFTHSIQL